MNGLAPLFLILLGAVNCLFGFKSFRFILAGWGFLSGVLIASLLSNNTLVIIIAGVAVAALTVVTYEIGIFIIGALLGALIGSTIANGLGITVRDAVQNINLFFGTVFGFIAWILEKPIIILATAFGGAYVFLLGFEALTNPNRFAGLAFMNQSLNLLNSLTFLEVVLWLLLSIGSVVFQYGGVNNLRQQYRDILRQIKAYRDESISTTKDSGVTIQSTANSTKPLTADELWRMIQRFRATPAYLVFVAYVIGVICYMLVGLSLISGMATYSPSIQNLLLIILAIPLLLIGYRITKHRPVYRMSVLALSGVLIISIWQGLALGAFPTLQILLSAASLFILLRDKQVKSYLAK